VLDEGPTGSITTERLRLDALTMEHVELLVALDADAEVMRHINGRASDVPDGGRGDDSCSARTSVRGVRPQQ
jgi:hypothetical protein